ncbi:MAG: hypothetical protein ACMUJM_14520 [bacterium]
MGRKRDKNVLKREIESLNDEIKNLGHRLSELLHVNCSFGKCILDPEVNMIQNRLIEAQEAKALLERIRKNRGGSSKERKMKAKEAHKR